MNIEYHPCFNEEACSSFGRIHLPVAPFCNVQCNFCNRKYDCVNESRPGVTSAVLSPYQALNYLEEMTSERNDISVVGIAGPGDPFANPEETLKTLELIRKNRPEMLLCLATNGLNILPYADDIKNLNVSHISITINAVNPEIGARIYAWVRSSKRTLGPREGSEILLENQMKAIALLKEKGMAVKINSVVIPGINEDHITDIAIKMGEMGVDIFNCMPYSPSPGSRFDYLGEPNRDTIQRIREDAGCYIKQMHHCTRCRADAAGLLNEAQEPRVMNRLKKFTETIATSMPVKSHEGRPYVAVASMEGALINQHLGEAERLFIYGLKGDDVFLADIRPTPEPGGGTERWNRLSESIGDCRALLVSGVGANPKNALTKSGIEVHELEGVIEDAVRAVVNGYGLNDFLKRRMSACGAECTGMGIGCG